MFCVTPDNRSGIIGRHSEKKVEVPIEFPTNVVEWMSLERMMILALSSTEVCLLLWSLGLSLQVKQIHFCVGFSCDFVKAHRVP